MGRTSTARARLLDAALDLVYARSYSDVGVQELCERANVRKGSFYHFFKSKEALTVAALEHEWARLQDEVLGEVFARDVAPLERIRRLALVYCEAQRDARATSGTTPGCHFGNLAAELSTQSEPVRETIRRIWDALGTRIEQALEEAVANGDIPASDAGTTALAILAYIQGAVLVAKVRDDPEFVARLADGVRALAQGVNSGAGSRLQRTRRGVSQ